MDALRELKTVTDAFAAELRDADPTAKLGAVRWTVTQLAAHLGSVHRWAAANITTGRRNPRVNVPELEVEPAVWYEQARAELLEILHAIDPETRCYTLSRDDRTVRFWHRRQLHESLVHLWDLRSRLPDNAPPWEVDAEVWADNVDELFDVFLPRSSAAERGDLGGILRLTATDVPFDRTFAADWSPGDPEQAAATVTAPADRLALFAWNRLGPDAVQVTGNRAVVERFRRSRVRP